MTPPDRPAPQSAPSGPRLLYSATMSLDGFIAGPGGDQSWLARQLAPNALIDDLLLPRIGALLVGARTFGGDDPHRGTDQEGAFSGQWSGPQVILTHHAATLVSSPELTFLDDLGAAVEQAKQAAGLKTYVNVLGASVGRQCLEAGLLDEVLVLIAPVMLGDGVPLFDVPGAALAELEPVSVTTGTSNTALWFRVRGMSPYRSTT